MKKYSIILLFSSVLLSCSFSPGSYAYAELYEINCSDKELIKTIDKFKNDNPQFIVPPKTMLKDGRKSEDDHWYHVYFYYENENQIVYSWVRRIDKNKSNFALIGVNQGLNLGKWKTINNEFSKKENKIQKNKFERLILDEIKSLTCLENE